ncbi:MAG: hypothetical protein R3B70_17560 [Polyangiaceae bacterium]
MCRLHHRRPHRHRPQHDSDSPSRAPPAQRRHRLRHKTACLRAARTTSSNPTPANSATNGYAVIQCFVPPKMGVPVDSHAA